MKIRNPMGLAIGIGLTLWFILFGWAFNRAHAVTTSGYFVVSVIRGGYDPMTYGEDVDSVFLYVLGGWAGGNLDSAKRFIMLPVQPEYFPAGGLDSLARYSIITPANLDVDYNPAIYAMWYLKGGRDPVPDLDVQITHMVNYADTLRTGVAATATVDYDSINDIVVAAVAAGVGGTGAFPETLYVYDTLQDAIVVGADVYVKNTDTSAFAPGTGVQRTSPLGRVVYQLDSATYPVAVNSQGYYQQSAYELETVVGPGGRDTVQVYSYVFAPPAGVDSCLLVIFTDVPYATAEITTSSTANQSTTAEVLNVTVPIKTADINGTIQVSLPRTASTQQKTKWNVTVKNRSGRVMLRATDLVIPSQAIDTLLVKATP